MEQRMSIVTFCSHVREIVPILLNNRWIFSLTVSLFGYV